MAIFIKSKDYVSQYPPFPSLIEAKQKASHVTDNPHVAPEVAVTPFPAPLMTAVAWAVIVAPALVDAVRRRRFPHWTVFAMAGWHAALLGISPTGPTGLLAVLGLTPAPATCPSGLVGLLGHPTSTSTCPTGLLGLLGLTSTSTPPAAREASPASAATHVVLSWGHGALWSYAIAYVMFAFAKCAAADLSVAASRLLAATSMGWRAGHERATELAGVPHADALGGPAAASDTTPAPSTSDRPGSDDVRTTSLRTTAPV